MNASRLLWCLRTEERPAGAVVPGDVLVPWETSWPRAYIVDTVAHEGGLVGLLDVYGSGTFYRPGCLVDVLPDGWTRKTREERLELARMERKDLEDTVEWYRSQGDSGNHVQGMLSLLNCFARVGGGAFHLETTDGHWTASVSWPSGRSVVGRVETERSDGLREALLLVLGQLGVRRGWSPR